MGPVILIVGLIAAIGGALIVMNAGKNKEKQNNAAPAGEQEDAPSGPSPFDDVDLNVPGSGRAKMVDISPPGLMEKAQFKKAEAFANEGIALMKAAIEADKAGDSDTYREKGLAAKAKLISAMEESTDWWMDLDERYPNDLQIKKIARVREKWSKALGKVRKIK